MGPLLLVILVLVFGGLGCIEPLSYIRRYNRKVAQGQVPFELDDNEPDIIVNEEPVSMVVGDQFFSDLNREVNRFEKKE